MDCLAYHKKFNHSKIWPITINKSFEYHQMIMDTKKEELNISFDSYSISPISSI